MPNTPTVPVVSIADDGTVAQYPSMNAAGEAAGVWQSPISMSCTHGYRCAGLHWMRERDYLESGREQSWKQT